MTPDQTIYQTALADGIPDNLSLLIVAQSKVETGNYTSNFFTQYNNAFGYSYVAGAEYQLPTPGTDADNGQPIAAYANIEDSTHEITNWIYRRVADGSFPVDLTTITTPAQYSTLLNNAGYFTASLQSYIDEMTSFYVSQITGPGLSTTASTGIVVVILAAIGFLLFRKK